MAVSGCSGIGWTVCKQSAPRSGQKSHLTPNWQRQSTAGAVAVKAVCARFFSSTFRDRTRSDLLCVDWNVRPRLESGSLLCTLSSQWTISCDFDDDEAATAVDRSTYTKWQSLLEVSVRVASPVAGCKMPSYEIQLTYYWLTYYSLFTTAYTAILHLTRTSYRGR